ncbi:hypothetical protein ACFE04_025379 [Oxalis oulophora]
MAQTWANLKLGFNLRSGYGPPAKASLSPNPDPDPVGAESRPGLGLRASVSPSAKNMILFFSPTILPNNLNFLPPLKPRAIITTASTSLRHVSLPVSGEADLLSSASAVASAIRKASSTSPVDFVQRIIVEDDDDNNKKQLVLPSPDFQRLCVEQLDLFRRILHPNAILSVYVRPAGSYVMDRLELRRVTFYPGEANATDNIVILIANFGVPTGLRVAESAISAQLVHVVAEQRALVFPMLKHPFVLGFLVAELPLMEIEKGKEEESNEDFKKSESEERDLIIHHPPPWAIQPFTGDHFTSNMFTPEQRLNAINISRSLAMAYVIDQKAMLLQQSSWQNNRRMSNLVEQIRGPLSSIRTLSNMLSLHVKKTEIAHDIVEDIMVQGDRIKNTLEELQEAVYLTKGNILRYNEDKLRQMESSKYESARLDNHFMDTSSNKLPSSSGALSLNTTNDMEMPMPPLSLAPLRQDGIR